MPLELTMEPQFWQGLVDDVVVMEDDISCSKEINLELTSLGCRNIHFVDNQEEAAQFIRSGVRQLFILDADLGHEREYEGFLTAKSVKKDNIEAFVTILSRRGEPRFRRQAERIGVSFVPKTLGDISANIRQIIVDALRHYRGDFLDKAKRIAATIGSTDSKTSFSDNEEQFVLKQQDTEWMIQHWNKYVAFADGKYLDTATDSESLISKMRQMHPGKLVFVARVGSEEETIDIPTLFFEE